MTTRPVGIPEIDICKDVAQYLARKFVWKADKFTCGREDYWRSCEEIAELLKGDTFEDDCDGYSYAAVYGLAGHGVKARIILCWTEDGGYHAVCESEKGYVLDCRNLGLVLTWSDRPLCDYVRDRMSGFAEFGEVGEWTKVKLNEDQT